MGCISRLLHSALPSALRSLYARAKYGVGTSTVKEDSTSYLASNDVTYYSVEKSQRCL